MCAAHSPVTRRASVRRPSLAAHARRGWAQANTCFNELLLPPYYSKERLADCLTISIYDGGDVFALR